jgi:GTP pyrophosphokinase
MKDSLINEAYKFGRPFIYHPMQVKKIITLLFPLDFELQTAAILHDTLEDTDTLHKDLAENFGKKIANLVNEVTKTQYNTFPHLRTRRGVILKFADRLSNLSNMDKWHKYRVKKYIQKSKFWE